MSVWATEGKAQPQTKANADKVEKDQELGSQRGNWQWGHQDGGFIALCGSGYGDSLLGLVGAIYILRQELYLRRKQEH